MAQHDELYPRADRALADALPADRRSEILHPQPGEQLVQQPGPDYASAVLARLANATRPTMVTQYNFPVRALEEALRGWFNGFMLLPMAVAVGGEDLALVQQRQAAATRVIAASFPVDMEVSVASRHVQSQSPSRLMHNAVALAQRAINRMTFRTIYHNRDMGLDRASQPYASNISRNPAIYLRASVVMFRRALTSVVAADMGALGDGRVQMHTFQVFAPEVIDELARQYTIVLQLAEEISSSTVHSLMPVLGGAGHRHRAESEAIFSRAYAYISNMVDLIHFTALRPTHHPRDNVEYAENDVIDWKSRYEAYADGLDQRYPLIVGDVDRLDNMIY